MAEQTSPASHADTRVLQAVHKTFRKSTTLLVDATGKLEPDALRPIIRERWAFYAAVLHHHHHNEDDSAFPALVAVRPDMKALVEKLEEDHRELSAAIDAVDVAVSAFEAQPDAAHQRTIHDAIVAVRDMFFPHLDAEDAEIIPAFAESIPPAEWDRMDQEALKSIPRPYLPTAVAALDEVIRSLPKEQQPPPPPLMLRMMLVLSWRRKWAEWKKPLVV